MKEDFLLTTERIDDCVVLLALMQQMDLPVVHSQTRPDVTVRKAFTYTCEESEEPL